MNRKAGLLAIFCGVVSIGLCLVVGGQSAATGEKMADSSPATTASQPTTTPTTMRVATYNVNYGVRNADDVASAIKVLRGCEAQLIAVQEGSDAFRKAIAEDLRKEYPYQVIHDGNGAGGFAWLSKLPIRKTQVLPAVQGGYFRTIISEVEVDKRPVQICNVHLFPTLLASAGGTVRVKDIFNAFEKAEAVREKEIAAILKKLAKDRPVVMMGDFNTLQDLTVHGMIADHGLTDSSLSLHGKSDVPETWAWTASGSRWTFRIDYIFHSDHFKTTENKVFFEGPSDHYLVCSTIQLLPPAKTTQPAK